MVTLKNKSAHQHYIRLQKGLVQQFLQFPF